MSLTKENSAWIEFLPLAPGLAFAERFALSQAGPRERAIFLKDCPEASSEDRDPQSGCWWDVQVFGWTVTSIITTAAAPSVLDPRVGGNRNPISRGTLKYLGDDIEFDIGPGAHFSIFAPSISLGIVSPAGARAVGDRAQSNFVGTPMAPVNVTSEAFNGLITPCVRPTTISQTTLTETRVIAAASIDIPVPARARTLQVFEATAGLPAAPMNWIQDPITGFDLGQIDFQLAGAPARTAVLEVPSGAQVVRTGAAARTITLVWGLVL
jgi:hypothetical protein